MFNKTLKIIAIGALALTIGACSKVPAGNVGVKVYLLGTEKGVDTEELGPGRYWIGVNEELFLFPTFTQNYVWTAGADGNSLENESITFQTKEGLSVNTDVGISYSIVPDKATAIFQKYRKGVEEITDLYLRNMVRDAFVTLASNRPIESVYGSGKSDLVDAVEAKVREQVEGLGINIEGIYLVNDLRLPRPVIDAINAKIGATQKAQQRENEIREAEAEAKKKEAEALGQANSILKVAEAQAKANKILAASISPDLVRYKGIEKWDGALPRMTGEVIPMISISEGQ